MFPAEGLRRSIEYVQPAASTTAAAAPWWRPPCCSSLLSMFMLPVMPLSSFLGAFLVS